MGVVIDFNILTNPKHVLNEPFNMFDQKTYLKPLFDQKQLSDQKNI